MMLAHTGVVPFATGRKTDPLLTECMPSPQQPCIEIEVIEDIRYMYDSLR
jgi:hypothetical protein